MRRFEMKRIVAMILTIVMIVAGSGIAMAKAGGNGNAVGKTRNDAKAEALYELDLFKGTSNTAFVAALERGATRLEAITLIGRALNWSKDPDFDTSKVVVPADVVGRDAEMIKHVQYALAHDVTKGIGKGIFGADLPVNARMMYTWYARALLYEEDVWNKPDVLGALGLLNREQLQNMNWEKASKRDDLVGIMYDSMNWKIKGTNMKLVQRMLKNMWLDYKAVVKAGLMDSKETELSYTVSQTSNKTLQLTFSHVLDETAAEASSNYSIRVLHRPYGNWEINTVSGGAIVASGGAITVEGFLVDPKDYKATLSETGDDTGKVVTLSFENAFLLNDKVFVTPSQLVVSKINTYTLDDKKDTKMIMIR